MRRIFNVYLKSFLVLIGLMLLSSCEADLTVKTNAASLDCAVLTDDTYCIKVRNGQINSVKDLALVQDTILTSASGFYLSWKMPETAKGILATKIMLASDAACTEEVKSAEIELKEQGYTFTDIKDGIYYGCVFARARAAGLLAANNNGIRIVVETALPQFESQSQVFYTNGRTLDKSPGIKSISAVSSQWTKISGPGELTFSESGAAVPTITASRDGSYTFSITAINEVGGKSTESFTLVYDSTPPILKVIAPILTSAHSIAIKAESEEDLQLYRWEIISAPGGATPELKDANSATTELSLPSLGTYELKVSLSDQAGNIGSTKVLVTKQVSAAPPVDTTNPAAPSAITVAAYSSTSSVSVSYTAGTDANFSTHNVKACAASDCSTGCQGVSQDIASPVTVSSLVNGSSYFICLQAVDLAGNTSAYVASGNSVKVDTTAPTAPAAIAWTGAFSNSTTAALTWTDGSDANFSIHNLKACTDSGCGASCTSVTQDAATPGSISGMIAGSSYYACLQSVDLAGNTSAFVASAATVMIDTTVPLDPTAVSVPVASNGNVAISFTAGAETNPSSFNIKACTSGCTVGCVGATTTAASPGTISGAALTNGNSYRGCVQGTDLAGNSSSWVQSSGLVIFDSSAPNGASNITVPAYSNSTSVAASFTVGTDANMSTHNFKACTSNNCSTGCLTAIQTSTSPANLTSLVNGTAYYACGQALDLAGNTSSFSFTPATVTIDTTAPGNPSAVSVPAASASSFNITFTAGTETYPGNFNIKACTNSGCSSGCVGATITASSPGTISSAALTLGTSYYGCVQGSDLAGNTSSFVPSAATVLYNTFGVTYNSNGSTGGSVPTDAGVYASGATVTVLGNTAALVKTGYTFGGWNTANNGTGSAYSASQTFSITANTILYAQWTVDCSSLNGGTYVMVPGDSLYGTSSYCVQKYAASNVGSVATSQTGTAPWVNINQTDSILKCAALGAGYHMITNPEWMTVAANLANVGSNWSLGTVGSGILRRGHSDSSPTNACAADASDANAYVETTCIGNSSGTFTQRRTSTLSNGAVVWDIGGNVWNWVNYNNSADKPTPATNAYYEYAAITGSATTPKSHLVPINSAQSWWSDSWNSAQGIGQIYPGTNGSGGAFVRGASYIHTNAGAFMIELDLSPSFTYHLIGFRCAYTPNTFAVTYDPNTATSGSPPNDPTLYASGNTVTVKNNSQALVKTNYTFAGWNTLADGTGTNYAPGSTLTISANTILYARWINCSGLAGGTWVAVPGDANYGTNAFCVMKYEAKNVSASATSAAAGVPWVSITQSAAITACSSLGSGYHLITNDEWMMIAANIANVGSNWSGGTVGSGTINRGHSDNNPAEACAASSDDSYGYVETDCTPLNSGTWSQKRTHTLSTGEVIWDLSGNVWDWTSYVISNNSAKPYVSADGSPQGAWKELSAVNAGFDAMTLNELRPINAEKTFWSDSWNSTQGLGQYLAGSNGSGGALRRGADWTNGALAGVFSARLYDSSSNSMTTLGFRCARLANP